MESAKAEFRAGKTSLKQIIDRYDLNIKLDADTSPARRSVSSIIGWIKSLRPSVQVGAYHRAGLNAPMATGGYAAHAAQMLGLAGGGTTRQRYPNGGVVHGPGTPTSDSVPAELSRDEFVTRAAAVDHYGLDVMYAINAMRVPREVFHQRRFAYGGTPRVTREHFAAPAPPPIYRALQGTGESVRMEADRAAIHIGSLSLPNVRQVDDFMRELRGLSLRAHTMEGVG